MSNKPALIVTVIVAALAAVAVFFAIRVLGSGSPASDPLHGESTDSEISTGDRREYESEIYDAASRLVCSNYEVFKLFNLMPYDKNSHFEPEPYGNPPEDGYFTLLPGVIEYDSVDEIFELVEATFVKSVCETIIAFSSLTSDGSPVYKEKDGKIGVNASFSPMNYDLLWGNVEITLSAVSDTEAVINVRLQGSAAQTGRGAQESQDGEIVKQMRMLKGTDGEWRLENIFY